jgi:hypothetical protein
MTDKILDFEQPTEDVIENYEEFDYLTDFYLPFQDQEAKYNSEILKGFRTNNIDPYEFLGEQKVNGIQPIELIKPEKQEQGKIDYSEAFVEFFKDLPESVALSTLENLANISNLGVQAVGVGANLAFKDTKLDKISDVTNSAANFYNRNTEQFVKNIETYAKNNDVNGVSKFMTDIGIDTGLSFPIYKQLKKVGVPSFAAMPLSFGLAYGFSGGEKEIDNNMIMDSQAINRTFELLNILPDTPESEIAEAVATAFEGTLWTAAIGPLTKTFKLLKNNVPAYINQQTAVSVGGAAATGEVVNQVDENRQENLNVEEQNQDLTEEKKNLNQSSSLEDADGLMASAGFGPIFTSILRSTAKKLANKGSGEQFLNQLKNTQGLKQQELKWSGLDDFLKDKKSVTKEEVKDFLQNNSLDVSEVKFSKNLKPNKELQKLIDDFEPKYIDERTNAPNYDVYETFIGKEANNRARGTMDFQTVRSVIGDDVVPESFEVVAEKFNTPKVLRYKNLNADDPNILIRPRGDDFFITPIELEKYKIERIRRMKNFNTGGVKFEAQTEAGGKDYTELVFRLKVGGKDIGIPIERTTPSKEAFGEKALVPFKNPSHFNVKNEIAHVRFKTRDLDGLKVLNVEEMQSDFAIATKKKTGAFVKDFPFRNNWYELTIKRLLRYAADNNFDAIAIPKGSVAAKRYGESINTANKVMYSKTNDQIMVSYLDANGISIEDMSYAMSDKAMNVLRKDVGEKIYNQILKTDKSGNSFIDFDKPIVVGSGKGKYELYDKAIPSFVKKYTKKWNAEVYDDVIRTDPTMMDIEEVAKIQDIPVTIIKLTDDMKQSVQQDGQALFSIFGIGAGAKIASDSMQNNIISEQTN